MFAEYQTDSELGIITNEKLEDLRVRIWKLEESLTQYGFEPGRGIETYSKGELRRILNSLSPSRKNEALQIISRLIELQEKLYYTLYRLAGATEVVKSVDTDTPEIRLQELKEWIEYYKNSKVSAKSLSTRNSKSFPTWVKKTLYLCLKAKNTPGVVDDIERLLTKAYKRKYDQFRVLSAIMKVCKELNVDTPQIGVDTPLRKAIELCITTVSKVPENELLKEIKRRYRS